jgi:hypothetical protein
MKHLPRVGLLLALLLTACGSGGREGAQTPRGTASVLTLEEMQTTPYGNLYDAIFALRPSWVRQRPPDSYRSDEAESVIVFLESVQLGDINSLRQLRVADVSSVQLLSVTETASRFGVQANAGRAIVVTSRKGP